MRRIPSSGALLRALLIPTVTLVAACGGMSDCYTCFDLTGMTVHVQDQEGTALDGVQVEVGDVSGGEPSVETTPSWNARPGEAHFPMLIAGRTYRVRVVPPAGYTVGPGQSHPVNMKVGKTSVSITFTLVSE